MVDLNPRDSLEIDADLQHVQVSVARGFGPVDLKMLSHVEEFPPLPMKTLLVVLAFFLIGSALIIFGTISEMTDLEPTRGIAFWILGGLLFIPGSYFTVQFYKAYRANTAYERKQILEALPDF
jgi:hypothetical protein